MELFFIRYGIWYRLEMGATGASANTKNILPINIPVLESSGNVAHSNGKRLCFVIIIRPFLGLCICHMAIDFTIVMAKDFTGIIISY
jgi:hypothetical protein